MKILISSYFPLGCTGYGNQIYFLCNFLINSGHTIFILCWDLTIPHQTKPYLMKEILKLDSSLKKTHPKKVESCSKLFFFF